jgi:hypothetical protein
MSDIKKAIDLYENRFNQHPDKIVVSMDYYRKLADQLKKGEIECFPKMRRFLFGIELTIKNELQCDYKFEQVN